MSDVTEQTEQRTDSITKAATNAYSAELIGTRVDYPGSRIVATQLSGHAFHEAIASMVHSVVHPRLTRVKRVDIGTYDNVVNEHCNSMASHCLKLAYQRCRNAARSRYANTVETVMNWNPKMRDERLPIVITRIIDSFGPVRVKGDYLDIVTVIPYFNATHNQQFGVPNWRLIESEVQSVIQCFEVKPDVSSVTTTLNGTEGSLWWTILSYQVDSSDPSGFIPFPRDNYTMSDYLMASMFRRTLVLPSVEIYSIDWELNPRVITPPGLNDPNNDAFFIDQTTNAINRPQRSRRFFRGALELTCARFETHVEKEYRAAMGQTEMRDRDGNPINGPILVEEENEVRKCRVGVLNLYGQVYERMTETQAKLSFLNSCDLR